MQIGYARVSTQDQDLSLQYDALRQAQCDNIYEDLQLCILYDIFAYGSVVPLNLWS